MYATVWREKATTLGSQFSLSVVGLGAQTQISRLARQTLSPLSAGPSHALQMIFGLRAIPRAMEML